MDSPSLGRDAARLGSSVVGTALRDIATALRGIGTPLPDIGTPLRGIGTALRDIETAPPDTGTPLPGLATALADLGTGLLAFGPALPGIVSALPGVGPALPGLGTAVSGLWQAHPEAEPELPGLEPALPGVEPALPGLGPALPGLGSALSGLRPALPRAEPALPGLGTALSGLGTALTGVGTALPVIETTPPVAVPATQDVRWAQPVVRRALYGAGALRALAGRLRVTQVPALCVCQGAIRGALSLEATVTAARFVSFVASSRETCSTEAIRTGPGDLGTWGHTFVLRPFPIIFVQVMISESFTALDPQVALRSSISARNRLPPFITTAIADFDSRRANETHDRHRNPDGLGNPPLCPIDLGSRGRICARQTHLRHLRVWLPD